MSAGRLALAPACAAVTLAFFAALASTAQAQATTCGAAASACQLDHDCCTGLLCDDAVCVDASVVRPRPSGPPPVPPTASPVHTVGVALLLGGGLIAATALIVPLLVCPNETTVDTDGQTHLTSVCSQLSDGVKIGWIAGGGIGLTLALIGGIVMTAASSSTPSSPGVSLWTSHATQGRLVPWVDGEARPTGGGASVRVSF
jgi:hypothetical protein